MTPPTLDADRYASLHAFARRRMSEESAGHTMQATALLHEAWLRLAREGSAQWNDDAKLQAAAKTAMRRILIERVRAKRRLKRGGAGIRIAFEEPEVDPEHEDAALLADLDTALERLRQTDPRAFRVLELRSFAGLDVDRTATLLGISERTVRRECRTARMWLAHYLRRSQDRGTRGARSRLDQHAS